MTFMSKPLGVLDNRFFLPCPGLEINTSTQAICYLKFDLPLLC